MALGYQYFVWSLPDDGDTALSVNPTTLLSAAFEDFGAFRSKHGAILQENVVETKWGPDFGSLVADGNAWRIGVGYPTLVLMRSEEAAGLVPLDSSEPSWVLIEMWDQS
jgi:hypothetical protein